MDGIRWIITKWKSSIDQGSFVSNCKKQKIKTKTWIEPTRRPPKPYQILSWIRKNDCSDSKVKLRSHQQTHQMLPSSRSSMPTAKGENQESDFKIDENSRKILTSNNAKDGTRKRRHVAFHDSTVCEVEEVDWDEIKMQKSQNYFLTASQNSQMSNSQMTVQTAQKKRILHQERRKEITVVSKNNVK